MRYTRSGYIFSTRHEAIVTVAYADGEFSDGRPKFSWGIGVHDPALKGGERFPLDLVFSKFIEAVQERVDAINEALKVPVLQHQFDALVDLKYQSGHRYEIILDLINAGKAHVAMDILPFCARTEKGVWSDGLQKRRENEKRLFMTGDYGDLSQVKFWRGNPRTTKPEIYKIQANDFVNIPR